MLKHSEVKPDFQAEYIQQAREKPRVMKLSAKRRKAYDRFMDNRSYEASMLYTARREGREKGRREGREEGLHEALVRVAKNMLAQNQTLEAVAAATGLSVAEIEKSISGL